MAYSTTTTRWMPAAATEYTSLHGKSVFSADDEKVGTIKRVFVPSGDFATARGSYYFLVDPGLLKEWFGGFNDVYLPESAIASAGDDRVTLTYTKDQIKNMGWTTKPSNFDTYR